MRDGVVGTARESGRGIKVFDCGLRSRSVPFLRFVELVRTPLYRFAHFERPGLGDEAMSAILAATSLLPTGIAFAMVVDIVVGQCGTDLLFY